MRVPRVPSTSPTLLWATWICTGQSEPETAKADNTAIPPGMPSKQSPHHRAESTRRRLKAGNTQFKHPLENTAEAAHRGREPAVPQPSRPISTPPTASPKPSHDSCPGTWDTRSGGSVWQRVRFIFPPCCARPSFASFGPHRGTIDP